MTTVSRGVQRSRSVLPPGQRRIDWFPRFGTDLTGPTPTVPAAPCIAIRGVVTGAVEFPVADLGRLNRREVVADFHCVAGWTFTDLRWEGVPFAEFFRQVIEPILAPGVCVTHVAFRGLDGERAVFEIADAMAESVLIADTLDGAPLGGDHGAPARIVSPNQYGYMNIKHLCRIDLLAGAPAPRRHAPLLERLLLSHPRARVWEEERHGSAPSWLVRPIYRAIKGVLLWRAERARHS